MKACVASYTYTSTCGASSTALYAWDTSDVFLAALRSYSHYA